MKHLRFLSYVHEVARVGSIRQAAGRLHIAPSAVNRRNLDIEKEIRTNRSIDNKNRGLLVFQPRLVHVMAYLQSL